MSRLPVPGGDNNNWGTILNDYLSQSINADGSLNSLAVATAYVAISFHSTAYTAGSTKSEVILTSGSTTITLPTAVGNGNSYTIKKIDSVGSNVTVATTSSQTIDGGATAVLRVQYASITVVSDGSNWYVV